ncbi:MAG TPA: TlpA family protein disulfide reductase [Caldithrix sp.]|nr:TlpA family protein disulfide reductase [Caldithrix sp.]
MKLKYHILVLTIALSSCQMNKENQTNTMGIADCSYNIDSLCNVVLKKQSQISLVKYNVRRVDTFDFENVWDNTGTATLLRNSNDSIFGFSFYGKRNDVDRENFYIENRHFQVFNEDRTYRIETNYGHHTLGSPGGQMVIVDLLNFDYYKGDISLESIDNNSFVIRKIRDTPDSTIIIRDIFYDIKSYIPYKIHNCVSNESLGLRQTSTFYITNVKINKQVERNEITNMSFLADYSEKQIIIDKSANDLLLKQSPPFALYTFNGDSLELNNIKSKVILLDFWELWCGPCRDALPKIEELSTKFNREDLYIIGIVSENLEAAKKLVSNEGITFTQADGNQELKSKFKVHSFPRYILIDKNRIIKKIYYGYSDNIESDIKNLL